MTLNQILYFQKVARLENYHQAAEELYISQPDSGDQALEITETMVRSGAMDIIVVDSVAALVPRQEIHM